MHSAVISEVQAYIPAHSLEAEQCVLGAILIENTALATAQELINEADFYRTGHQTIYRAMIELAEQGNTIENVILTEHLTAKGLLEGIGGAAYIAELIAVTPHAANVAHHAKIVAEKARRRTLQAALSHALHAANNGADSARLAGLIHRLHAHTAEQSLTRPHLGQALLGYDDLLLAKIPDRATYLPWLSAGSLAMIFGPRGIGKTMLGAGVAVSLCTGTPFLKWPVSAPVGVLYVDGEMPLDALRDRFTRLLPCPPIAPLKFLTAEHVYHTLQTDLVLSAGSTREQIVAILDAHPTIKVVVLDNISCLFSGIDEDKKREWEPINAWLIRLRHRGITTILMHHAGKGGQQRGTSGREDALDLTIQLDRPADYDSRQGCRFELRFTKARGVHGDTVAPLEVRLDAHYRLTWTPLEESKEEAARKLYADGVTRPSELAEELGITKGYASKLLRKVKGENRE